MGTRNRGASVLLSSMFLSFNLFASQYCTATDNLTTGQLLRRGQTLISYGQIFELGFFSPNNSRNRYVGIWYKKISPRKVVWVANREKPLTVTDTSASLTMGSDGNLKLVDGKQNTVWSTNVSIPSNHSFAVLLDNGDFVLKDGPSGESLWKSFNYPCDTVLPSMTIGINLTGGEKRFLTSWKSEDDPSPGKFVLGLMPQTPAQAFIWNGLTPYWRSGQWDKAKFIGVPEIYNSYIDAFVLEQNTQWGTAYLTFRGYNSSTEIIVMTSEGSLKTIRWDEGMEEWLTPWEAPKRPCDIYGACGPFGVCNKSASPNCRCLKGYVPKSSEEWSKGNWTGGCVRRTELLCQKNMSSSSEDGFWEMNRMKLPDFSEYIRSIGFAQFCRTWCMNNCSCEAYAFVEGIGCMIWATELMDIQEFSVDGEDLFLRLAHSELKGEEKQTSILIISFSTISSIIILVTAVYCWFRWKANQTVDASRDPIQQNVWGNRVNQRDPTELPMFDFDIVLVATNNFSITNKLGQGGFGPVYKGKLQDGKEIAVKRLSNSSGQGIEEFKNEIILISKLQHKNLVRLLGCCIQGDEKLLIYEYMPNKSLDTFLFDPIKRGQLDWAKRFNIIQGIARGLLYLHRDSCLRVIHRDMKVSNILLDGDMNPKISDFGLARTFRETQDLANTHRVVGTFGYMSPEYTMRGIFSEKSDVFSFGVLLLEIVSGRKNTSFHHHDQHLNLLGYAWELWNQGRRLDLMDEALADSVSQLEVMRCIHIGLLCVQDHAADRPAMSAIVLMLGSETDRPQPKKPTFTFQSSLESDLQSQCNNVHSINEITQSIIEGR